MVDHYVDKRYARRFYFDSPLMAPTDASPKSTTCRQEITVAAFRLSAEADRLVLYEAVFANGKRINPASIRVLAQRAIGIPI